MPSDDGPGRGGRRGSFPYYLIIGWLAGGSVRGGLSNSSSQGHLLQKRLFL